MDMVGELVIAQSQVAQAPQVTADADSKLATDVGHLESISREIRDVSLSVRMVPVAPVFTRMQRLVRDLAGRTGKSIQVELAGEDTELDKNVVDAIVDPLTHMVRNAVDLAKAIGITRPKVAMLSAVEIVNPGMPSSVAAKETVDAFQETGEDLGFDIAGPFAFDNAISPEAARIKGVNNPVAGQADIIVSPNIETANAIGRIMVNFMSAVLAGVVMGAKVPFVLTSRADPAEARLASIALARKISEYQAG